MAVEVEGGGEEAAVEEGKGVSAAVGVVKASVLSPPIPQRLSLRALLPANPPVPSVH